MSIGRVRPLSYAFVRKPRGDVGLATYVRGTCGSCAHTEDIPWERNNNPAAIAQHFERRGWRFDAVRIAKCLCPVCVGEQAPVAATKPAPQPAPVPRPAPEAPPMQLRPTPAPLTAATLDATPDQKRRVRDLLDQYFDDATGCYLPDQAGRYYSDQRVAAELGLPWALVAKIREQAYGPLRTDPEVVALHKDLEAARSEQALLEARIGELGRTIQALADRLAGIARRFSSGAAA